MVEVETLWHIDLHLTASPHLSINNMHTMPHCAVITPLPLQQQADKPPSAVSIQYKIKGYLRRGWGIIWGNFSHQLVSSSKNWHKHSVNGQPSLFVRACHPKRPRSAAPLPDSRSVSLPPQPPHFIQPVSRQCSRRWKLQLFVNVAPVSKCQARGHSPCSWAVSEVDRPYGRSRSMLSPASQTA